MIDIANVKIIAGKGGDGIVTFRREKFVPKGGPNGGDGGRGGDVYLVVNGNLTTLMDFRAKAVFKAQAGEPGASNNRHGANGEDLYLEVPSGTLIRLVSKENKEGVVVADLKEQGEIYLIASGGIGGRGNSYFKSSINRTPRQSTPGEPGEEKEIILEVKLIADVGLIGLPNAGKSTLLNALTRANAKIGSYPFTTIEPNLGVMDVPKLKKSIVLADLPGLIEGAAQGKGLGDEFLRHVDRTRLLVHVIDPFIDDPLESYRIIRDELKSYSESLGEKKELVVINKTDTTEVKDKVVEIKKQFAKKKVPVLFVSGATGEGIEELKIKIASEFEKLPQIKEKVEVEGKKYTMSNLPNKRVVFKGKPLVTDHF